VKKILAVILVLLVLPACAMKQRKVEKGLEGAGPPNCATAEGDLRVLQSEKANVAERIAAGVTAIVPAGLVLGLVTGTEGVKVRVAIGKYNDALDRRIAEIKETCGVE
jgi:hypothetical protein